MADDDDYGYGFEGLIKAFTIFQKYTDTKWPTHCEHDTLMVLVNPDDVSDEDKAELDRLGFNPDDEYGDNYFSSYRFGSA